MEDFTADDIIVATECKHFYHKACFEEWLNHSCSCPVCRTDIPGSLLDTNTQDSDIVAAEEGRIGTVESIE